MPLSHHSFLVPLLSKTYRSLSCQKTVVSPEEVLKSSITQLYASPIKEQDTSKKTSVNLAPGKELCMYTPCKNRLSHIAEHDIPSKNKKIRNSWDKACCYKKYVLPLPNTGNMTYHHLSSSNANRSLFFPILFLRKRMCGEEQTFPKWLDGACLRVSWRKPRRRTAGSSRGFRRRHHIHRSCILGSLVATTTISSLRDLETKTVN